MDSLSPQPNNQNKDWIVWLLPLVVLVVIAAVVTTVFAVRAVTNRRVTTQAQPQVAISTSGFSPETIRIKKGQSIVWLNVDNRPHGLVGDSAASVNLTTDESLNTGDRFATTFDQAGTYSYHDSTLPTELKGTIIVE